NYYFFIVLRNNEKKQLNLHRHLRSTGLRELASDTLSETLPTHMWWQVNTNGDNSTIKFRRRNDIHID
uniref:hypothetical protein n=1 Tax=Bacteroides caecimuris TaxID=1796613 RepID=UPI0025B74E0E